MNHLSIPKVMFTQRQDIKNLGPKMLTTYGVKWMHHITVGISNLAQHEFQTSFHSTKEN